MGLAIQHAALHGIALGGSDQGQARRRIDGAAFIAGGDHESAAAADFYRLRFFTPAIQTVLLVRFINRRGVDCGGFWNVAGFWQYFAAAPNFMDVRRRHRGAHCGDRVEAASCNCTQTCTRLCLRL